MSRSDQQRVLSICPTFTLVISPPASFPLTKLPSLFLHEYLKDDEQIKKL